MDIQHVLTACCLSGFTAANTIGSSFPDNYMTDEEYAEWKAKVKAIINSSTRCD
jgi:hypothetical protein